MPDRHSTTAPRTFGVAAVAAVLILGACSAGGSDGVATAGGENNAAAPAATQGAESLDADAQALAFAQCMRDNGVDMPDPGPGQQGLARAFRTVSGDYARPTLRRAFSACQDLMPQYAQQDHTDDDWQLELAECLREQGLEVSDKPFDDAHSGEIDVDEFSAAMEVCRNELTGGDQ